MSDIPPRVSKLFGVCRVCGAAFDRRRYVDGRIVGANRETQTCLAHRYQRTSGVLVDKHTPYEEDTACQMFVAAFPGGATLDAIAEAIGVSRERVRQIQSGATRKLGELGLAAFGVDASDPAEQRNPARHDEVEPEPFELDAESEVL